MATRPAASYSSYRDYVSHLVRQYPEYRWLERFLAVGGREPSDTQLHLLDCIGDELRVQHITGYTDLSDRDSVRYALENRSPDVAVRIVYVTYRQSWSINRDIVELLGLHFNVNPLFFWGHFQSYYSAGDTLCPEDLQGWGNPVLPGFTSPLPSDQTSIELACVYDGLSTLLLDDHAPVSGGKTVLVMCRSGRACISGLGRIFGNIDKDSICSDPQDPSWKFLSRRYIELLQIMPPEDIRSACNNPIEFIYPYVKLFVSELNTRIQDIAYHLESQFFLGASGRAETTALESTWAALHDMVQDIRPSLQSLASFPCPESPKRTTIIRDFDDLLRQSEAVQRTLRDYLSRHVGMKSLEESRMAVLESRKSIEQAESVKRLTQLAFVFLPLNLATSLFGMNMTEFGTGNLHIWVFVAVALSLSLLVGLAVFVFARKYREKTS